MQGIIFNALEEFVLENASMEVWNSILDENELASGGSYTSGQSYDDKEIDALASTLCKKLDVTLATGLGLFGEFLFEFLLTRSAIEIRDYKTVQELLSELESVIHRDVKRIHPGAYTPLFEYVPSTSVAGILTYRSKRKLCMVAEGLVKGAAKHYQQEVKLDHTQCMHNMADADECVWEVKFS